MNDFTLLLRRLSGMIFMLVMAGNLVLLGVIVFATQVLHLHMLIGTVLCLVVAVGIALLVARAASTAAVRPVETIWRAVMHVSKHGDAPAPKLDEVGMGRELIKNVCLQIYDLASSATKANIAERGDTSAKDFSHNVITKFPLPVIILDQQTNVVFVNEAAQSYAALDNPLGSSFATLFGVSYTNADTIEHWLQESRDNRLTDSRTWHHIKLRLSDNRVRLCDVAAHYSKDNPLGYETILTFFDNEASYANEETGFSYIAMAVHDLRTPLTIMRGYIEALDDEIDATVSPTTSDYVQKLTASSQQLTAFITNILNVSRIDEGAYQPNLQKELWGELLGSIGKDMELRARLRGKHLTYDIEPSLPEVAVDRLGIYEVVANLIDNAIKYSPDATEIIIHSRVTGDGMVETIIQDFGIGMPDNVIKQLFTKFYRNHRSKTQVSGSGIGLFLVKSLVTANGGHVWVKSKDGEGSSFGFTLRIWDTLTEADKLVSAQNPITHQAHGWIKNHSLQRR